MSDEQRKQFEANFLACSPMSLPSAFTRDSVGGYENDYLQQRWHGWVEGQRARDAEVQALREALTEVAERLAFEIVDKHGPIQAHPDAARSFYRAMEPVYRARRLLGGGGGDSE